MTPELLNLFEPYEDLLLAKAGKSTYQSFRNKEPQLKSCSDGFEGHHEEEILLLYGQGKPMGVASLAIRKNINKPRYPKIYVRLDLVIVDEKYRNLGVGRLLILCCLLLVLGTKGKYIYSISCIAAHETVEKILKELGFEEKKREGEESWQGFLNLEEKNYESLQKNFVAKAKTSIQATVARLRNSEIESQPEIES